MSAEAVGWVLAKSCSTGNDRCVLTVLADVANDQFGNRAWYTIEHIAEKSQVSIRTAQRSLRALVGLGELEEGSAAGTPIEHWPSNHRPVVYRLTFKTRGVRLTPLRSAHSGVSERAPRGDKPGAQGRQIDTQTQENSKDPSPKGANESPPTISASHSTKGYIAKYVGWFEEAHGTRPWKSYIDRLAKQLSTSEAKECTTAEIENAVYCIAKEGKRPHVLLDVIGDYRREVAS